ncbi:MAG: CBS domain-containing protein [Syntrophobacterales bacterium]|nr:MAG: CBS domain-containing protein [Syntrophobacterales bacterium]
MTKARDLMTKEVKYIQEEATIKETLTRMKVERVSSFIVERKDHDDAYGIITRKDIITKVVETGRDLEYTKVKEIMTKPILMVSPGLDIKYVVRLMKMGNIRRAPIFDGKEIVGILSNTDIINALLK